MLHWVFPNQHGFHHKWKFRTAFSFTDHFFNWLIFPIGWLCGFSTTEMLPTMLWTVMFTFMSHREYKPKPMGKIFMSLRGHEAHHDKYNKNYGVMLTLWDRLAGTYE